MEANDTKGRIRKRRRVAIAFGVVVVAAIIAATTWPEEKEPEYKGKKLSEWLILSAVDARTDSDEAVRAIGTNAIPFLVKCAIYECPRWKSKLWRMYFRHPGWPGRRIVFPRFPAGDPKAIQYLASAGFSILGEKGAPAVSALSKAAHDSSTARAVSAIQCLAFVGTNALPPMLDILANTNEPAWKRMAVLSAMHNMKYLGSNALPAIPVLVRCTLETNNEIGQIAHLLLDIFANYDLFGGSSTKWSTIRPDAALRCGAVRAAADLVTNEWAFRVVARAKDDPDPSVQAEAVRGLTKREALGMTTEFH